VAILKRGNGPVTVTPRRVLRPRLYTPKTEERELTESPEVEQVKREGGGQLLVVCWSVCLSVVFKQCIRMKFRLCICTLCMCR
jgi:hypothetical protein